MAQISVTVPPTHMALACLASGAPIEHGMVFDDRAYLVRYADGRTRRWVQTWDRIRVWPPGAMLERAYSLYKRALARAQRTWDNDIVPYLQVLGEGTTVSSGDGLRFTVEPKERGGYTFSCFRDQQVPPSPEGDRMQALDRRWTLRGRKAGTMRRVVEFLLERLAWDDLYERDIPAPAVVFRLKDDFVVLTREGKHCGTLRFRWLSKNLYKEVL
jgi:hypothetical protein